MPALTASFLLPAALAATSATFLFGKRKPEVAPEPPPLPAPEPSLRTLLPLATFTLLGDGYADREACGRIWDALELPVRDDGEMIGVRYFAVTAFDPAPPGREATVKAATELARDATERGYSVLLIDADVSRPFAHSLPLFAPRNGDTPTAPSGVAEFLRGDAFRLEPLLKLAWRTEGLLLLPAGVAAPGDSEAGYADAAITRLLRLASSLAQVIIVVAAPLFGDDNTVQNGDLLPRMDGVLVAYPSVFSAASDTEALEKLEGMSVAQVGAIVTPTAALQDDDADAFPPTVIGVYPALTAPTAPQTPLPQALAPETPLLQTPAPDAPEPIEAETIADTPMEMEPLADAQSTDAPRPSFMTAPPAENRTRRGDARRGVPIEAVPVYPNPPATPVRAALESPVVLPTVARHYRPDVSLELIPANGDPAYLTLRAEVGGSSSGAKLLLEIRTIATDAKRLRADNPGTNPDTLLVIESLTAPSAPDDATTLRLVVRESGDSGAAILLEAVLETPDALRIKSGKASAASVPPVRFEVTTEPDDTARFRATVPALGDAPALFVDLERTTTGDGRVSRIVLRLATEV